MHIHCYSASSHCFLKFCSLAPAPFCLQYPPGKPDPMWLRPVDQAHAHLTVMTQSRLETKRRGNDGFLWAIGKGKGWQIQIRVSPITCSTEIKLSVRCIRRWFNWFYAFFGVCVGGGLVVSLTLSTFFFFFFLSWSQLITVFQSKLNQLAEFCKILSTVR